MPQIQINGELKEVSQAEYDALTQNGQAGTPAYGSYEEYAAAQSKAQALEKLAAADGAVTDSTNVSPAYAQGVSDIKTAADTAAGDNKDAYAARYAQEEQNLYTNAPTSREALESELSAPPPTTSPGTVGVAVPQQQGTDGQVIGTLNTAVPGLSQPTGSIVSEPVRGLTSGGLTSGAATTPSYPTEDPQIPPPSTEGVGAFTPPPAPDAAFAQAQVAKEERWQQAAATNPEGIQDNGSVKTQLPDGTVETINRDGSYSVSGAEGTYRFNADGQVESYTSPTVNGLSTTITSDGVQYTNYSAGPLTTSTITKDGEPISTTTSYDFGSTKVAAIQTVGGQPVLQTETNIGNGLLLKSGSTILTDSETQQDPALVLNQALDIVNTGVLPEGTQVEVVDLAALREERVAAYEQATAANVKLREDLIAAKQQQEAGIPLSDTQIAALEEQAQVTAEADAALAQAEQAVADQDPTVVAAGEDPQVAEPATQDPLPSLATTEAAPAAIDAADDPGVAEPAVLEIPVAEIDTGEQIDQVSAAENPEVPQPTGDLPPPIEYVAADAPTEDPIVLAQADNIVTDVPVADIDVVPADVPVEQVGDELVDLNTGEVYGIDPETGFVQSGDQPYISPEEIPVERQGDVLVDLNSGQEYAIDPDSGFVSNNDLYVSPDEIPVEREGDVLVDLNSGQEYPIDPDSGFVAVDGIYVAPEEIPVEREGDVLVDLNSGQEYPIDPDSGFVSVDGLYTSPDEIPVEREGDVLVDLNSGEEYPIDPDSGFVAVNDLYVSPEDLNPEEANVPDGGLVEFTPDGDVVRSPQELQAQQAEINQAVKNAQAQATLAQQMRQANQGDWRVKLRLAPGADYLYRANDGKGTQAGILQPLAVTDGVIFPYTPQITTAYRANYSTYDLTHSNYRGYFYQSSYVDDIQIQATFTAQDTKEAEYLLAVIHFFRSITKMFYGKDPQRGAPPPLVFLQGLGQFQFNLHPCVVAQFNYNLPNDVDYIRARSPNIYNTSLLEKRDRKPAASTSPFISAWERLKAAGNIPKGAVPGANTSYVPILGTDSPTYVPTKIDMTIILHPIQSRQQVSNNFSLAKYANGDLIKGGTNQPGAFW